MSDPRRDTVLSLIIEWDPEKDMIHEHLGMTLAQWDAFKWSGKLPADYQPREPTQLHDAPPPKRSGRPLVNARAISRETIDRAIELRREGLSGHKIAAELKCNRRTIERALAREEGH